MARGWVVAVMLLLGCGGAQVQPQAQPDSAQANGAQPQQVPPPDLAALEQQGSSKVPSDADFPPAVLSGQAELHCTISSSANGRQTLRLAGGQGVEFDAAVSPIVDGVVEAHGPDRGGSYRFTSHLAAPAKGTLSGIGEVEFDVLETKVNVAMDRYKQPGGPGTQLTFEAADMAARGIYVEFAGRAHSASGERYAFRVTLGAPGSGSGGQVVPSNDAERSNVMTKMVSIEAPVTSVVTTVPATTTVQTIK